MKKQDFCLGCVNRHKHDFGLFKKTKSMQLLQSRVIVYKTENWTFLQALWESWPNLDKKWSQDRNDLMKVIMEFYIYKKKWNMPLKQT